MECLRFQRLLEISLAAGQICDPIRASLMRKCSLTQRENKEGRGECVNGKREVEREKEGEEEEEEKKEKVKEEEEEEEREETGGGEGTEEGGVILKTNKTHCLYFIL